MKKKVVGFSGSPRQDGNTDWLVRQVLEGASAAGAEIAFHRVADLDIRGCRGCCVCRATAACVQHDAMELLLAEVFAADAVVLGSPVYIGQISGQLKVFLDRLLPVLATDYTSRLVKRPNLLCVSTQGNPDANAFRGYMEETCRFLQVLGFTPRGCLAAAGVREKGDIVKQTELLVKARAAGAALLTRAA